MIKLEKFDINAQNVTKIIDRFKKTELPRLQKLYQYYDAENIIKKREMDIHKPNNKLVAAYAKYITNVSTGYFMGINVKYKNDKEENEYKQALDTVLEDSFEEDINFENAKNASIFGYGAEIIYQNESAVTKFKKLDPRETILIFGDSVDSFLLACIRYYQSVDINDLKKETAVVYDEQKIYTFTRTGEDVFELQDEKSHPFQEIPIVIYKNNEEMKGDFEDIVTLNDAYDAAESNTANDMDYFTDAYLVISGGGEFDDGNEDGTKETAMREKKVFFFPDKGDAKFLIKEINDSATENYKNRLNSDIHKFAFVPDISDEKFAGNLSGIAIKYKTIALEQISKPKEKKFRVGLRKRRELITRILNAKNGKYWDFRDIKEEFTRNLPQNDKENVETVLSAAEYISRRTLFEQLSFITDVDEELKRIQEEQDEYDKRDYNFSEDIDEPDEM